MRRKPEKYPDIILDFPIIFWKTCDKCKQEFLWEQMWCFEAGFIPLRIHKYLCMDCAPTKEDVIKYRNRRPKEGPPMPCVKPPKEE